MRDRIVHAAPLRLRRMYRGIPDERRMWKQWMLEQVPGFTGMALRNRVLPYKHGERTMIHHGVHIDCPDRLILGDRVGINRGTTINAWGGVKIGDDVLIGPKCLIYSQNHQYRGYGPIKEQGYTREPVYIGDDVWLAAHVVVLPGVSIGDRVIVGAGAVVSKDLPPHVIAVGNPAVPVKELPPLKERRESPPPEWAVTDPELYEWAQGYCAR